MCVCNSCEVHKILLQLCLIRSTFVQLSKVLIIENCENQLLVLVQVLLDELSSDRCPRIRRHLLHDSQFSIRKCTFLLKRVRNCPHSSSLAPKTLSRPSIQRLTNPSPQTAKWLRPLPIDLSLRSTTHGRRNLRFTTAQLLRSLLRMAWRHWDTDCKRVGSDRDKKLDNLDRERKTRGETE